MLYASHYFWTGLEVRALMPDPARGTGFRFLTVSRSRHSLVCHILLLVDLLDSMAAPPGCCDDGSFMF